MKIYLTTALRHIVDRAQEEGQPLAAEAATELASLLAIKKAAMPVLDWVDTKLAVVSFSDLRKLAALLKEG